MIRLLGIACGIWLGWHYATGGGRTLAIGIVATVVLSLGNLMIALATAPGTYAAPVVILTAVQDAAVGSFRANGINDIAILTQANGTSTERMRVTAAGRVGTASCSP